MQYSDLSRQLLEAVGKEMEVLQLSYIRNRQGGRECHSVFKK